MWEISHISHNGILGEVSSCRINPTLTNKWLTFANKFKLYYYKKLFRLKLATLTTQRSGLLRFLIEKRVSNLTLASSCENIEVIIHLYNRLKFDFR